MKKKASFQELKKGDAGRQDVFKTIAVDFSSHASLKKAEGQQKKLFNEGYSTVDTKQVGFDKFKIILVKSKRKMRSVS